MKCLKKHIEEIIDAVLSENKDTEFLLVSCMQPNVIAQCFAQNRLKEQEEALYALQARRENVSIGVAPVHSMFLSLCTTGKTASDYTGDNVNHPNDFGACIYAQMVVSALEG